MTTETLDGPRLAPQSGADPEQLVILLHGVGADGNDLIGLAPHFAQVLPNAAFVSPNAPAPCDMAPYGYQWYSVQNRDPEIRLGEIRRSAGILNTFIDAELARHGFGADRLALVGFSQGTIMSLYTAPRRELPCAGILGYSGRLEAADRLAAEARSRPPIVLVHGDADTVIPSRETDRAAASLRDAGFDVAAHHRPGLAHGIDEDGIRVGISFLEKIFARP